MNRYFKLFVVFCLSAKLLAFQSFIVNNIKVEGLHNIQKSTFDNNLIIKKGDRVDAVKIKSAMQHLYKSKFFTSVKISKLENNAILIKIVERPMVISVDFSGQKTLQKEDIENILAKAKLQSGKIYDANLAEQIKNALIHFSEEQGVYNIKIKIEVEHLSNNRVRVNFLFDESEKVKVKKIEFIGNKFLKATDIKSAMSLQPHLWSFITDNDKYSDIRLTKDIQSIKDLYANHGYVNAKISKHSVKINDNKAVIVININEGDLYKLGKVNIKNKSIRNEINTHLDVLKPGQVFSRQQVMAMIDKISLYYKDLGYAYVKVKSPMRVRPGNLVDLELIVNKGPLVIVRHIDFFGNSSTNDKVLRREMLQYESELYSSSHVSESIRRINNLGYIRNAQCKLSPIKHHRDQADLNCFVTEAPSISASVSLGYGSQNGALFQLNFSHKSLFGTGYGIRLNAMRMVTAEEASLSLYNPYFTTSGISQNISLRVERFAPAMQNDSSWYKRSNIAFENKGVKLAADYGIPASQFGRFSIGGAIRTTDIKLGNNPDISYAKFISDYGNSFKELTLRLGWKWNNLDRVIFPTHGGQATLDAEVGLPINDLLHFYKLDLKANWFHAIDRSDWIIKTRGGLGFGRGYGDRGSDLPFFKNYFAGGMDTVRGFAAHSLGDKDSEDRAIGGSMRAYGSVALILPQWFNENVRTSMFLDAGGVAKHTMNADDFRYSAGISLQWRTAIAPLVFSLAVPLENHVKDQKELFAFELGTVF